MGESSTLLNLELATDGRGSPAYRVTEAIETVAILASNFILAESLRGMIAKVLPAAEIQTFARIELPRNTPDGAFDLLVVDLNLNSEDVLDDLCTWDRTRHPFHHIVAMAAEWSARMLLCLRHLRLDAVLDSSCEGLRGLESALNQLQSKRRYWSPGLLRRVAEVHLGLHTLLSPVEQLVLAAAGDGSDDATIARMLVMKPSSVQSVRRDLHRKLGLQQKGELVRFAVQHGYVRFCGLDVVRPGFSKLISQCPGLERRKRIQSDS
jgi:DNA-binding NarL/FixJ family response regulator